MSGFHDIVSKAMADTNFCENLIKNPEGTLREHGVEPTNEMIDALKGLDAGAVQRLAAAFGKQQAAS